MTRADFSTGNLGRDWNSAIINGFQDLNNPDTDILVTIQDDCKLVKDWTARLYKMYEKGYTLIVGRHGDNFVSYKAEAIKKIGLFDERIYGIAHKEGDYWLRALIFNKEKSLIADLQHKRLVNDHDFIDVEILPDNRSEEWMELRNTSEVHLGNKIASWVFFDKWEGTWKSRPEADGWLRNWSKDFIENPPSAPKGKQYIYYYYFEKDIEDLAGKNYVGFSEATKRDEAKKPTAQDLMKKAFDAMQQEKYGNALNFLLQVKTEDRFLKDYNFILGYSYLKKNRFKEAQQAFYRELRYHPDTPRPDIEKVVKELDAIL